MLRRVLVSLGAAVVLTLGVATPAFASNGNGGGGNVHINNVGNHAGSSTVCVGGSFTDILC